MMTRKWLQSVSVEVDANGAPALESALVSAGAMSSGMTPMSITDNNPIDILPADPTRSYHNLRISSYQNYDQIPFVSWDGGNSWHACHGGSVTDFKGIRITNQVVQMRRAPGGSSLFNLYASAW